MQCDKYMLKCSTRVKLCVGQLFINEARSVSASLYQSKSHFVNIQYVQVKKLKNSPSWTISNLKKEEKHKVIFLFQTFFLTLLLSEVDLHFV